MGKSGTRAIAEFKIDSERPEVDGGLSVYIEVPTPEPKSGVHEIQRFAATGSELSVYAVTERFDILLKNAIRPVASTLNKGLRDLPDPPTEAVVTFGMKVNANLGIAFISAGGESHFTIQLSWKK